MARFIAVRVAGVACVLAFAGTALAQTQADKESAGAQPADAQGAAAQPVTTSGAAMPVPPDGANAQAPATGDPPLEPGEVRMTNAAPPKAAAMDAEELRSTCEAAIAEDAEWRTELKENLAHRIFEAPQNERDEALRDMVRLEAHKAETERLARNEAHVIYAYAALWILMALFVGYMFVRQRSLNEEIARLERELKKAI